MNYFKLCLFCTFLLTLFLSLEVKAQENDAPIQEIEKIIFSTHGYERSLLSTSQSGVVLNKKDIESLGAVTVEDVLSTVSGVDFISLGAPAEDTDVRIRGSDQDEVVVMLDGVRLNDLIQSRPLILNSIPLEMIERVEVVKGSASIIHGSDAGGGVINLITKKGIEKTEASAAVKGGNLGRVQESVQGQIKTDKHYFGLGFSRIDQKGRFAHDRFYENALFFNYHFAISDDVSLSSNLVYMNHKQELAFDTAVFDLTNFPVSLDDYVWPDNNRNLTRDIIVPQVNLQVSSLKNHTINLSYSMYYESQALKNSNQGDRAAPGVAQLSSQLFDSSGQRHIFDLRDHIQLYSNDHIRTQFVLGVAGQLERLRTKSSSLPGDVPIVPEVQFPDNSVGQKGLRRNIAGYGEGTLEFNEKFFLSLGLRYDDNSTFGNAVSYRASSYYMIPKVDVKLFSTFSRGFKAPTINQY